ncbi:MAG: S9 family peptidase [Candidatus Dormibacteraeota bacterium]|nr:S9 family peptidase [Candidatus Dormibacteraeota bacterium]
MPKTPFLPEDIYNFRWVEHARLAPGADRLAYVVRRADREAVDYRSSIHVRAVAPGFPALHLTPGPQDSSPEWSPDGQLIAHMRRQGTANQLFLLDPADGESRRLTTFEFGVSAARWSPDGSRLAVLASVIGHPEGVVADPRPPERESDGRPRPPIARIAQGLDYKFDGRGYLDGRRSHLFTLSVKGGEPTQVTAGRWDVMGFDWSSDGTQLVVAGNADPDADLQEHENLYVVSSGGGELRRIAGGLSISEPRWSPTGDRIVFVGTALEGGSYSRLWTVSPAGGDAVSVTEDEEFTIGDSCITDMRGGHGFDIRWSADGKRVYFPAALPGRTEIWSCRSTGGDARPEVAGDRQVYDWDLVGEHIAFCAATPSTPGEVSIATAAGEEQVTQMNPWFAERHLALPERMEFTAPDGLKIEGWLLKPPGFDPSRRWPLVMEVHGGPHAEYGWTFFHEFQILAGGGFLVFYANPRGSSGYGEDFQRACVQDWGGKDYEDLMTALDQLIERTSFIDTERMGIGGGSYGGFMTNWVVGHTDRFRAAVSMRSISNFTSDYRACDISLWNDREMGRLDWADPRSMWDRSPIRFVENIRTPLLLTHGEMDLRCPIHQAEELFGALRVLGRVVELVRFPEETHDLSRSGRPDRRIERLNRIAGWFERFLLGTATAEPGVRTRADREEVSTAAGRD